MIQFRPLRADEIECRISTINANGLSLLLYKDARVDMRLLDETVGPLNWKRSHQIVDGNLYCTVEIWDETKEQWVSKQDVGTESYTEKEKGQASDSFKRAGFNWGIGRELYTAPFIWINPANCTIKKSDSGKLSCYDRFKVGAIEITDGVITALEIRNASKDGKIVFSYKTGNTTISTAMYNVLINLCKQKGRKARDVLEEYGAEKPSDLLVTDWEKAVAELKGMPDVE